MFAQGRKTVPPIDGPVDITYDAVLHFHVSLKVFLVNCSILLPKTRWGYVMEGGQSINFNIEACQQKQYAD